MDGKKRRLRGAIGMMNGLSMAYRDGSYLRYNLQEVARRLWRELAELNDKLKGAE